MEIGGHRFDARVPDHAPAERKHRSFKTSAASQRAAAVVFGIYVRRRGSVACELPPGPRIRNQEAARGVTMRASIAGAVLLVLAALPAAATPILTVTPSAIGGSPAQTVLTFDVDPNATPVSTLLFNLSSVASGLEIVGIQSAEPGTIIVSGPALVGSDYQASFSAFFFPDRTDSFTVGTLTVEGFTPGTPLVLSGEFTDPIFNTIAIGPTIVAVVMLPEPGTASLVSLGLLGLAFRRSSPRASRRSGGRPSNHADIDEMLRLGVPELAAEGAERGQAEPPPHR
jgi:hypothetical protein